VEYCLDPKVLVEDHQIGLFAHLDGADPVR
jgi:hypothetical protein